MSHLLLFEKASHKKVVSAHYVIQGLTKMTLWHHFRLKSENQTLQSRRRQLFADSAKLCVGLNVHVPDVKLQNMTSDVMVRGK